MTLHQRIATLRKQGKSLQELADMFDITRERVRQLELRARFENAFMKS